MMLSVLFCTCAYLLSPHPPTPPSSLIVPNQLEFEWNNLFSWVTYKSDFNFLLAPYSLIRGFSFIVYFCKSCFFIFLHGYLVHLHKNIALNTRRNLLHTVWTGVSQISPKHSSRKAIVPFFINLPLSKMLSKIIKRLQTVGTFRLQRTVFFKNLLQSINSSSQRWRLLSLEIEGEMLPLSFLASSKITKKPLTIKTKGN